MAFESCVCLLLGSWWIQNCPMQWRTLDVRCSDVLSRRVHPPREDMSLMDSVMIRKTLTSTHIIASPSFQRSPNLLPFPISIGMHRISQPQYYWHFRSEILSFWVRVSGSYAWQHPSVYPLDANSHLLSCDHRKCLQILPNVPLGEN